MKKICGVLFEGYIFKGCNLWNVTFVLAFVVYGLSGEMGVLWVMFMFSGVSVYYVMTLAPKK